MFEDFKLLQDAICINLSQEVKELLTECILWNMGSIPIVPKSVLNDYFSEKTVNDYYSLPKKNNLAGLYMDILVRNPDFLTDENVLYFICDIKEFNGYELLKNAQSKKSVDIINNCYLSEMYYDLEMLYIKYRYSRLLSQGHNDVLLSQIKHKLMEICDFWKKKSPVIIEYDLIQRNSPEIIEAVLNN
jgi:hypothetical protein